MEAEGRRGATSGENFLGCRDVLCGDEGQPGGEVWIRLSKTMQTVPEDGCYELGINHASMKMMIPKEVKGTFEERKVTATVQGVTDPAGPGPSRAAGPALRSSHSSAQAMHLHRSPVSLGALEGRAWSPFVWGVCPGVSQVVCVPLELGLCRSQELGVQDWALGTLVTSGVPASDCRHPPYCCPDADGSPELVTRCLGVL